MSVTRGPLMSSRDDWLTPSCVTERVRRAVQNWVVQNTCGDTSPTQWEMLDSAILAAIGASQSWYVYDPEDGLDRYQTATAARERAHQIMDEEADRAGDGWRENIDDLEWALR